MQISRNLNLIAPLDTERGTVYIHSTPISRAIFEKYYKVLSKTYSALYTDGYAHAAISGPRIAAMLLKDTALATPNGHLGSDGRALDSWVGPDGVEHGLMSE